MASDTHYIPAFPLRPPRNGKQLTVCGLWIAEAQFSTEPTCIVCKQWLEQDAKDFKATFGEADPQ